MDSQYNRGMTWNSDEGIEGMHILDARPDENGESTDTYMKADLERITAEDNKAGSAVTKLTVVVAA
jgi:hypothetical protein